MSFKGHHSFSSSNRILIRLRLKCTKFQSENMPVNWKSIYRVSRQTCKAVQDFPRATCAECATFLSPHLLRVSFFFSSVRYIPPYSTRNTPRQYPPSFISTYQYLQDIELSSLILMLVWISNSFHLWYI